MTVSCQACLGSSVGLSVFGHSRRRSVTVARGKTSAVQSTKPRPHFLARVSNHGQPTMCLGVSIKVREAEVSDRSDHKPPFSSKLLISIGNVQYVHERTARMTDISAPVEGSQLRKSTRYGHWCVAIPISQEQNHRASGLIRLVRLIGLICPIWLIKMG